MTQTIAEALAEMDRERTGASPIAKGITAEEAAAIAKEYGLGLTEAAALKQMSANEGEAKRLAKTFQPEHLRQLTEEDLKTMTPEAIVEAKAQGRTHDIENPPEEEPPEGQLGAAGVHKLSPQQVMEAKAKGQLDWLLKMQPPAGQLSRAQMDELEPAELARAKSLGKTDWATGNRERFTSAK